MSINHANSILADDGDRIWRVMYEVWIDGNSRAVVGMIKPIQTTGTGSNVLTTVSVTWEDTRLPAELQAADLADLIQIAVDAESNYLEGWLDENE